MLAQLVWEMVLLAALFDINRSFEPNVGPSIAHGQIALLYPLDKTFNLTGA